MRLPASLHPGRLIQRYKRFLADVTLDTGETVTAHCPNPGSMMGLKAPGSRCWLSHTDDPKRKLKYTLEVMEADDTLVGINTNRPNKLAEAAILNGRIPALSGYDTLRREVKYGVNSRIDLLLEDPNRPSAYVEVKNCHLRRSPGLTEFPDSVTTRGAKHLGELSEMVRQGHRAVQLFIVQRNDCDVLSPADDIDPAYAQALRDAAAAGVEIIAWACAISVEEIEVVREIEARL